MLITIYNIGIIVTKSNNGITGDMSFAVKPGTPEKQEVVTLDGREMTLREIMDDGIFDGLAASFPLLVTGDYLVWKNDSMNRGNP